MEQTAYIEGHWNALCLLTTELVTAGFSGGRRAAFKEACRQRPELSSVPPGPGDCQRILSGAAALGGIARPWADVLKGVGFRQKDSQAAAEAKPWGVVMRKLTGQKGATHV